MMIYRWSLWTQLRKDYHYDEGEEFFYQLKVTLRLKLSRRVSQKILKSRKGFAQESVPRPSTQTKANTIGLVIERHRRAFGEKGRFYLAL
jgi:3-hydroxyanthranilate 3,4-dioxygenase